MARCILLRIQFTQLDVVENKDEALFEENVGGFFCIWVEMQSEEGAGVVVVITCT